MKIATLGLNKVNMKFHAFGLLHLNSNERTAMNLSKSSFNEQVNIYTRNSISLAKSLKTQGIKFTLLTNDKSIIEKHAPNVMQHLSVEEIPFTTNVPSGIRFYSAHHKLDAFKYLSNLQENYVALLDLDMLCINKFPECLKNIIKNKTPLYYDISDQVIPAYGHEIIIKDLQLISKIPSEGRWSGGEFISGSPGFFKALVTEIEIIYENYIKIIPGLHHVGDEAFTSAALERLKSKGIYIGDAGTLGIVGRYWNTIVLHPQKSFDYFKKCFLLHAPADKKFLAGLADLSINQEAILALYQRHTKSKSKFVINKSKSIAKKMISLSKDFASRVDRKSILSRMSS